MAAPRFGKLHIYYRRAVDWFASCRGENFYARSLWSDKRSRRVRGTSGISGFGLPVVPGEHGVFDSLADIPGCSGRLRPLRHSAFDGLARHRTKVDALDD